MAHQADKIPWEDLASHLKWVKDEPCCPGFANFHPRGLEGQEDSFINFVKAFTQTIGECATAERRKYRDRYDVPSLDDVVISDKVAEKINPTVEAWRKERELHRMLYVWDESGLSECPSPAKRPYQPNKMLRNLRKWCYDDIKQFPTLPQDQRRMGAFVHDLTEHLCETTFDTNGPALLSMEVAKTLLLRGEMDTLLRICSFPEVDIRTWWRAPKCSCPGIACIDPGEEISWRRMYTGALTAYIVLNLLSLFPDTLGQGSQYPPPERDYRHSRAYQYMLVHTTEHRWMADVTQLPHRQFFGLRRGQLSAIPSEPRVPLPKEALPNEAHWFDFPLMPTGFMPYDVFRNFQVGETGHLPTALDIAQVRAGLMHQKGLPAELVNEILSRAEYDAPRSRLRVPHHPLHPDNAEELQAYLEHCWAVMVRCEVVAREVGGVEAEWVNDVTRTLNVCFNCRRGPKSLGEIVGGQRLGMGGLGEILLQFQMLRDDLADEDGEGE